MRIIAGEARGRRLHAPEGTTTRPILDLLKQRLFDVLGPRVQGRRVWDLFAGVGSMGLEALSRGASEALFVEGDRTVFACLRRNLEELGFGARGTLHKGDALRPEAFPTTFAADLVFLDPPFPMVMAESERILAFLEAIAAERLAAGALLVWRVPTEYRGSEEVRGLSLRDRREHGVNRLILYDRP